MAISYNVYANDGNGGEVDYQAPIASTTDLVHVVAALAAPSDNTFAVRAFDTTSGIEEANTDARVRVIIDRFGDEVTAQPNGVIGLSARPTAGGTCWVSWGYVTNGQGGPPSTFNVTLTVGATPSLADPVATVAYLPGVAGYGCSLSGLPANTPCVIAVQAIGASGALGGPVGSVSFAYLATPLSGVDSLAAIPTA